mgnify:CR=1 FL=1
MEQTILFRQLSNGLRVFHLPKAGFSAHFAMLAVRFGAADSVFALEGEIVTLPAGVAHFLEHKMFEGADGNALQKFSALGASPNAFTNYGMTAYHFECADRFYENLRLLLSLVSTPYFTEENVEKEKGIIGQEIGMIEDNPYWQGLHRMLAGLYPGHPVRHSIAGTVESIGAIRNEMLALCHRAFYTPDNMVLVTAGEGDVDRIAEIAGSVLPNGATRAPRRFYGSEKPVRREGGNKPMAVASPIVFLGVKQRPLGRGESRARRLAASDLLQLCLFSEASPFYDGLYEAGWIDSSFGYETLFAPGAGMFYLCGESRAPGKVREAAAAALRQAGETGLEEAVFQRAKRTLYGGLVRRLDSLSELCRLQAECAFAGEDLAALFAAVETAKKEDVAALARECAGEECRYTAVIEPNEWRT